MVTQTESSVFPSFGTVKYLIAFTILISAFVVRAEDQKLALIYKGPGACEGCPEAVGRLLQEMKIRVRYVSPGEFSETTFKTSALYVQPGGTGNGSIDTLKALGAKQVEVLRSYVSSGGKYLGICAGGYLAGQFWERDRKTKAFSFLPVIVNSESNDQSAQLVSVIWKGKLNQMYFQYGPYFDVHAIPGVDVWATYKESGRAAALIAGYGKGKVGVIGPHPEATKEWFDQDGLNSKQGLKLNLAKDFIGALLK
jgi:glutamine amidotransferase-like uncharacterized protein